MKFAKSDERYLSARKELSEKLGPQELWAVADHWPLFCGVGNLARFVAILDLLRTTLEVPGHIAEFGTWRGANTLYLAKLMRILDPHGAKQVHAFDSFRGLETFAPEDRDAAALQHSYRGSLEMLRDVINLYEMGDEIAVHEGLIADSLPPLLAEQTELTFSFVYCDVDLYEPTKQILELLHPRLSKGGLFVLDQWNYENFQGETVAVREFLEEHGAAYEVEAVRNARQPSAVLRKTAH